MYNNINYFVSELNKLNFTLINDINEINYVNNFIENNNFKINKWNVHKKMVSEIKKFKTRGTLIYNNGIKKIFLRFYLDNIKSENYRFTIYTFFGMKLMEFIFNNDNFFLKEKNKLINIENKNTYILEKNFNIKIPIKNLSLWIIGLPGDSKEFKLNDIGILKEIKYINKSQKYIIKYHKYHNNIKPFLPESIEFNDGNNNIKFKINNWILS